MVDIENLRSFRVADYAVFDFVASYVGFYFLATPLTWLFKKIGVVVTRAQWMYLMLPISVVIHLLVGEKTHLIHQLFDLNGGYIAKIVLLVMIYKGIKG